MPATPWANPAQLAFLNDRRVSFAAAQRSKTLPGFWTDTNRDFFALWPNSALEAECASEKGSKARPTPSLDHDGWVTTRKSNIYNWFNNHALSKGNRSKKVKTVKISMPAAASRVSSELHVYSKKYYSTRVKPAVDAELGDKEIEKKQRIAMINKHLKEAYEKETPEVKAEIRLAIQEEQQAKESAKEADRAIIQAYDVLTPEQLLTAQASLHEVISDFCDTMEERTGWKFVCLAGGPNPLADGAISTIGVHTGRDAYGHSFRKAYANYDEAILKPFSTFLHSVFPETVRQKYSIAKIDSDDLSQTGTETSLPSKADDDFGLTRETSPTPVQAAAAFVGSTSSPTANQITTATASSAAHAPAPALLEESSTVYVPTSLATAALPTISTTTSVGPPAPPAPAAADLLNIPPTLSTAAVDLITVTNTPSAPAGAPCKDLFIFPTPSSSVGWHDQASGQGSNFPTPSSSVGGQNPQASGQDSPVHNQVGSGWVPSGDQNGYIQYHQTNGTGTYPPGSGLSVGQTEYPQYPQANGSGNGAVEPFDLEEAIANLVWLESLDFGLGTGETVDYQDVDTTQFVTDGTMPTSGGPVQQVATAPHPGALPAETSSQVQFELPVPLQASQSDLCLPVPLQAPIVSLSGLSLPPQLSSNVSLHSLPLVDAPSAIHLAVASPPQAGSNAQSAPQVTLTTTSSPAPPQLLIDAPTTQLTSAADQSSLAHDDTLSVPKSRQRKPATSKEVIPLTNKATNGSLPQWLAAASDYLKDGIDSDLWSECLEAWMKFEAEVGLHEGTAHRLVAKSRPAELTQWLKSRQYDAIPVLDDLASFSTQWVTWWNNTQPKWRVNPVPGSLPLPVDPSKDMAFLKKGGPNGLVTAMMGLRWWAPLRESGGLWLKAVQDMKECLEEMSIGNKRKAAAKMEGRNKKRKMS